MPPPNDDTTIVEHRATSSHKGSRGITHNGVPNREPPETNMPGRAVVRPVIPGRLYRAQGLNIGREDFSQRGVAEGLSQVVDAYNNAPGSQIVVTGGQSPSVRKDKGDADLPIRRAEAAKKELVKRGIPADAIIVQAGPPSTADPHHISPEEKAKMRGAMFEVVPPKKVTYSPKGFTDGITYVKEGTITTVLPPPPGWDWEGEGDKGKRKKPTLWDRLRRKPGPDSSFVLQAAGLGLLIYLFSPELILGAFLGYGGEALVGEKVAKALRGEFDKPLRKYGILRVDIGQFDFPKEVVTLVENKYRNANYLIWESGKPARYVRSTGVRDRPGFVRQWKAVQGLTSGAAARKDLEGFEVDESLSLQLSGTARLENQELQYGRINDAMAKAEQQALRRGGFELGDPITYILLTNVERPADRYRGYEWYQPRGTEN